MTWTAASVVVYGGYGKVYVKSYVSHGGNVKCDPCDVASDVAEYGAVDVCGKFANVVSYDVVDVAESAVCGKNSSVYVVGRGGANVW